MPTSLPIAPASYTLLVADPPWDFGLWSEKGWGKSAQRHYNTMPTREICALREPLGLDWIMAPNSACVLWATFPMLPDAFRVMEAWGFSYETGGAWHKRTTHGKTAFGTGYILRSAAEIFLIGTRGRPPWRSRSVRNVIEAPVRGHSRKPDAMYEACERLLPGPYLELFARQTREGWTQYGDEVGKFDALQT